MEFIYKDGTVTLSSEKKEITLLPDRVDLDGLMIEMAGEYEKSGCLMYAWQRNDENLYHFRVEGHWIAYIPQMLTDISSEALDFLGTVDILIMPGSKLMQWVLEKIEPRLLVTYGDMAHEIATPLGMTEVTPKYKLREADLSSDKTGCIVLG